MNVTLKLPDDLLRAARHRAVNEAQSLSAWLASLMRRELDAISTTEEEKSKTLAEAMMVPGMPESFYEQEFLLEDRKKWTARDFTFEEE